MSITTSQIRGARGILDWSQAELSKRTGISTTSIGNIESGNTQPRESTLQIIRKAFEDAGIEFLPDNGVRMQTGQVKIYTGRVGVFDFYKDVHKVLAKDGGEVLVSNVDEKKFVRALGDAAGDHIAEINKLEKVTYKILTQEGDDYFPGASYAQYRWVRAEHFASVPFYVYGSKLGIILFDNEPTIIVMEYAAITEAYRTQFMSMWDNAIVPPALAKAAIKAAG
jgi:transcriptional regulator with XRE-family HTH domain